MILDRQVLAETAPAQRIDELVMRDGVHPRHQRLRLVPCVTFQMHGKQDLLHDVLAIGVGPPGAL
jgi:hypothetical protein